MSNKITTAAALCLLSNCLNFNCARNHIAPKRIGTKNIYVSGPKRQTVPFLARVFLQMLLENFQDFLPMGVLFRLKDPTVRTSPVTLVCSRTSDAICIMYDELLSHCFLLMCRNTSNLGCVCQSDYAHTCKESKRSVCS